MIRLAKKLLFLMVGAAGLAILITMIAPLHWRIAKLEQGLLGPWLRPAYLGDGKPAEELLLYYPMVLTLNRDGELLISDRGRGRSVRVIWRIDAGGIATPRGRQRPAG